MIFGVPVRSIRTKFLLVGSAAVLLSGSVSFFLAAEQRRQLEDQLRSSAVNLARQTEFVMAPLIAFDSRDEMKKALELLRINPDFAWASVSGETGTPLVSVGGAPLTSCDGKSGEQLSDNGGFLRVSTPILDGGKTWGCLQLGISEERSRHDAKRLWTSRVYRDVWWDHTFNGSASPGCDNARSIGIGRDQAISPMEENRLRHYGRVRPAAGDVQGDKVCHQSIFLD